MQLHIWVGLGGVDSKENKRVRYWGSFMLFMMLVVILTLLTYWSFHPNTLVVRSQEVAFNMVVWAVFLIDMTVALFLVNRKFNYLQRNWLKIVILLLAIPPLAGFKWVLVGYRFLHPIIAVLLLTPWSDYMLRSLSDNRLATTLVTFFVVVVVSGFLMAGIDPSIHNPWQGFWYVLVTMSTVGYGDYVPTSFVGQLMAAGLILLGLGFFAIVTANIAAIFLQKNVREIARESHEIFHLLSDLSKLRDKDDTIYQILKDMEKRLTKLEKQLVKSSHSTHID